MYPLANQMNTQLDRLTPPQGTLVVGVSGGADSIFTALQINAWAQTKPHTIIAATVDHGLRPESSQECQFVADLMHAHKIDHVKITWTPSTSKTTQQDARNARYTLLTDCCTQTNAATLVTGHHALDQAETILMRFARQSHLRGLRGMDESSKITDAITLIRPLLNIWPDAIKADLRARDIPWIDDPSNAHTKYLRTHLRKALTDETSDLRAIGVTPQSLINWSHKITATQAFLTSEVLKFMPQILTSEQGFEIRQDAFFALHSELQCHVLETFFITHAHLEHAPRWDSLKELRHRLQTKQAATLGGWKFQHKKDKIVISAETKI